MNKSNQSGMSRQVLISIMLAILVVAIALVTLIVSLTTSHKSVSLNTTQNCASSAIIKCGSDSTSSLQSAYKKSNYAQTVYQYFSINSSNMKALGTTAVVGSVNQDGDVYVATNSSPVATNAVVAVPKTNGAKNATSYKGVQFTLESPGTLFTANSEPAFVVMKNTVFDYAIIASGDNPVSGTDITAFSGQSPTIASTTKAGSSTSSTKKSTTAPAKSTTKPAASSTTSSKASSSTSASGTTTSPTTPSHASTTPSATANTTSPAAPSTATTPLASTGPSTIQTIVLFAVFSIIGTVLSRMYIVRHSSDRN
jgi:hypothetical protein